MPSTEQRVNKCPIRETRHPPAPDSSHARWNLAVRRAFLGRCLPFQPGTVMAASRVFAFEVEHIQAMEKAFDAVCGRLELSTRTEDRGSELVALRIIELVMAGGRDAGRLPAR